MICCRWSRAPSSTRSCPPVPSLRRLGPIGDDALGTLHEDLLHPPAHEGRPHVALNFVMTADGRVSYRGRAEIGTRTDRELMFHLRSLADAVMVGAGTLRVDSFAPVVRGRERQPLAIVVTRTAELPLENRFFGVAGPRLVATTLDADTGRLERPGIEIARSGEREVDLGALLGLLHERGIRFLLCEGGPTLAGRLLAARLVDELFLTHATLVTAEPDARRLFEGGLMPAATVRLERVSLHEGPDGERYERSRIRYWS